MELKMTRTTYQFIERKSLESGTEIGGQVIGTTKRPIATRATKAGNHAELSYVSYTNDPAHDNEEVRKTIEEFDGRVSVIGRWHKHPGNMHYPSSVDLATARGIVKRNEEEGDRGSVFFIITNVVDNGVKFHCYALDEDKNFEEVRIKLIDDNAREIEEALKIEPVIVQPREMDFWRDSGFQFYLTKTGYERLQKEVNELRFRHYVVKVHAKGQLYVVISKDNETIVCMPPAEYPLNPPRFFRRNVEISYSMTLWNSSYRIIDILQNLAALHIQERRHHESHNNETGSICIRFINGIERVVKSLWLH